MRSLLEPWVICLITHIHPTTTVPLWSLMYHSHLSRTPLTQHFVSVFEGRDFYIPLPRTWNTLDYMNKWMKSVPQNINDKALHSRSSPKIVCHTLNSSSKVSHSWLKVESELGQSLASLVFPLCSLFHVFALRNSTDRVWFCFYIL